jgi:hypothetical protein
MDSRLNSEAVPVQNRLLPVLFGFIVSKALLAAAQLGVAERLAGGPATAEDLARQVGADAPSLYRLLRILASFGIFREGEDRRFTNTDLSDSIREDAPNSMKSWVLGFCGEPSYSAWNETTYSIQTGKGGFARLHGSHPFEHMAKHPEYGMIFGEAMTSLTGRENPEIHKNLDLSGVKTLVDIAGGNGSFLVSCLERNPGQRGILFEREDVIPRARPLVAASSVANRCEVVAGDFFKEVPSGGDAYMLKYILHDWSDEEAIAILKNIHRASAKGTKLYTMDMVIEPGNAPSFPKIVDLFVLVYYGGGRERTKAEFEGLFRAAGFRLNRVAPTSSIISTLEAVHV